MAIRAGLATARGRRRIARLFRLRRRSGRASRSKHARNAALRLAPFACPQSTGWSPSPVRPAIAELLAQRTCAGAARCRQACRPRPCSAASGCDAPCAATASCCSSSSTTGEGDAPDTALPLRRATCLSRHAALRGLRYGVLALGDREYAQFCGFGHRLDGWLRHAGAAAAVRPGRGGQWRCRRAAALAAPPRPAGRPHRSARLERAVVSRRGGCRQRLLGNDGSVGGAAFHIALEPEEKADLSWQAGDIAEIGPRNSDVDVAAWLAAARLDAAVQVRMRTGTRRWRNCCCIRAYPKRKRRVARRRRPWPIRSDRCRTASTRSRPCRPTVPCSCWCGRCVAPTAARQRQRLADRTCAGRSRIDLRIRSNPGFHLPEG